jgi:TolA-binding protein
LALMVCLALPLGCLYPAERGRMLEERLDHLEADKKELETALKAQKNKLDEQVAQVQAALDKLEKTAHRTGADIGVQMEQVQGDLSQLRGQVEQYQHQLTEIQAALDKLKSAPVATGKEPGDTPEKKPDAAKKPEPTEKPTDRKAFAELVEKTLADDVPAGRKLAEEWFKKFPKPDAAKDVAAWAPSAAKVHYLLATSHMAQKDCRSALSEFGEIVKSFSKSDQAPEALLKSSECFAALKMNEESRLALEEIVNSYPKSEVAKDAKARLAELKKPKAAPKKK